MYCCDSDGLTSTHVSTDGAECAPDTALVRKGGNLFTSGGDSSADHPLQKERKRRVSDNRSKARHRRSPRRRCLDATYVTRIAAKAAPEGGGGDYGPDTGGFDQLGFGTLAFTRDKATKAEAEASPSVSKAAGSGSDSGADSGAGTGATKSGSSASPSASASAQGGRGDDLAATGSTELVAWSAAGGVAALAGGPLLLRRRNNRPGGGAHG
jgi:LPXTG-motif cell wall-anchored protein